MRLFPILLSTIVCFASPAMADETSVEVRTVTGEVVRVESNEVRAAYVRTLVQVNPRHEGIAANEDGSVIITRPWFRYNNQPTPYGNYDTGTDDTFRQHNTGICRRFGFSAFVQVEKEVKPGENRLVYLNEDGTLKTTNVGTGYYSTKTITCR